MGRTLVASRSEPPANPACNSKWQPSKSHLNPGGSWRRGVALIGQAIAPIFMQPVDLVRASEYGCPTWLSHESSAPPRLSYLNCARNRERVDEREVACRRHGPPCGLA